VSSTARPAEGLPLIIAEPGDTTARAVAGLLGSAVTTVTPVALATGRWHQRIDGRGRVTTSVAPAGGNPVSDRDISRVWCRVTGLPAPQFARAGPRDLDYATAEFTAVLVSWLLSLGEGVVNRVTGDSACGPAWSARYWLILAQRAGLPVMSGPVASGSRTVLIVGDRVMGAPASWVVSCRALSRLAGCQVLGLEVGHSRHGLVVTAITPTPVVDEPSRTGAVAALLSAPS
jgi:hypothetical protein